MRYFFDIFDGDHWTRDDLGVECASDQTSPGSAGTNRAGPRAAAVYDGPAKELVIRVRLQEELAFSVRLNFDTSSGPALTDLR